MKTTLTLSILLGSLVGFASPSLAQTSSTTTTGTTTILQPVTITQNNALAFGSIVRPITGTSTVTLGTANDTVTVTGSAIVAGGAKSRARYTVSGEGAQVVSVTMPATFNLSKAGATDLAVALTRNPAGNLTLSGTLGTTGTASLDVGGSFSIANTTVTGDYSGTFTVSVAYN